MLLISERLRLLEYGKKRVEMSEENQKLSYYAQIKKLMKQKSIFYMTKITEIVKH